MSPAPRFWGFAPRGIEFLSPLLMAPDSHLGLRPKPRARGLNSDRKRIDSERQGRGVCTAALQLIKKICDLLEKTAPFSGASLPAEGGSAPSASRGVLGRSPEWERKAKARQRHRTLNPFAAKPQRMGCRGIIPLPGSGAAPQRPPYPSRAFFPIR